MLSSIPVIGGLFTALSGAICWTLSAPPEVVVHGAKSITCWLLGGTCN